MSISGILSEASFFLQGFMASYPNHTLSELVSALKHAPDILNILLRVVIY